MPSDLWHKGLPKLYWTYTSGSSLACWGKGMKTDYHSRETKDHSKEVEVLATAKPRYIGEILALPDTVLQIVLWGCREDKLSYYSALPPALLLLPSRQQLCTSPLGSRLSSLNQHISRKNRAGSFAVRMNRFRRSLGRKLRHRKGPHDHDQHGSKWSRTSPLVAVR